MQKLDADAAHAALPKIVKDLFSIRDVGTVKASPGTHYDVGLVIPFWNRPSYLQHTLASLRTSALARVIVLLVDDASDDPRIPAVLENHGLSAIPVLSIRRQKRVGPKINENLCFGWDLLEQQYSCKYFAVLDSDMSVRPHWLEELRTVHVAAAKKYSRLLLTGFNAPQHPVLRYEARYCIKKSVGGCLLFFDRALYRSVVRPCLVPYHAAMHWDWSLVNLCQFMRIPLVCTCPSVAQHRGKYGWWSQGWRHYDWAPDYYLGRTFAVLAYPILFVVFKLMRSVSLRLKTPKFRK